MSLFNYSKQKKKLIFEALAASFVVAFVFAAILPKVFATTAYYVSDASVELDGVNNGVVNISLKTPVDARIFSVEGNFPTGTHIGEFDEFTLIELNPGGGLSSDDYRIWSNDENNGRVLFQDGSFRNPMVVDADGAVWNMIFDVNKDTVAGDYVLCVNGLSISREILDDPDDQYPTENIGNVCATVTVTRNEPEPPVLPSQVVTFRDGDDNPITEITKYYGDEDFEIKKEVTTGDGAILEYHPDDDGTGRIAHTDPDLNSNIVGVGEPGDVEICAWVAGTENYAATKACYTVHVTKRPITIAGATIANKTYDGTRDAEVTAVEFSNLGNGTPPTYTAKGEFGTAGAGVDKAIRVDVTLPDDALEHYILSPSYYNTTKTILPFGLVRENVELVNGDTYTYDPDEVEPEVRVTVDLYGGRPTLVENQDYEVSYSDNMSVGTGHVTVTGMGNFTTNVPIVLDYTINKKGISNEDVIVPGSIVEGRILDEDDVSVVVDGHTLIRCAMSEETNCDYLLTISGDNDGEIGHTVNVTVEGRKNYEGTVNKNVSIEAKLPQTVTIADVTNTTVNKVYGDENFTYVATTVDDGGEIRYRSTAEAVATVDMNTGEVTIRGVGDADIIATAAENDTYAEGSAKYTVHVDKGQVSITNVTVATKTYDGTTVATISSASLGVDSLVLNTDFTATGTFNNANAGERVVTVNITLGSDAFELYCFATNDGCEDTAAIITNGTIEAFNLNGDTATATLTETSFVYNGEEREPEATVKADLDVDGIAEAPLVAGTDYEMSYDNNVNAGTSATATVTGKGNYTGSLEGLTFSITPVTVENVVVTAASQDYAGEPLEPVLTVTGTVDGESKTFTVDDYTVATHEDFVDAGDYTVTINSKDGSNYNIPTTSGTFTIDKAESGEPAEMTAGLRIAAGCTLAELGERSAGFNWVDPSTVVSAGEQTFDATYIKNNDTINYLESTVSVPVYGLKRISVLTSSNDGGEVVTPGALAVEGDQLTWTVTPDDGYEIAMFYVNDDDVLGMVSNNQVTVEAGTENVVAVIFFRRVYNVIRTEGVPHVRGVDGTAEFEIDADYELFEEWGAVYVDGEEISDENYDSWSASTVISLKEDYLNSLTLGEHLLEVEFVDGGIARVAFVIADPEASEDEDAAVPSTADTGIFTGVNGGAVVTGVSMIVMGAVAGVIYGLTKRSKRA